MFDVEQFIETVEAMRKAQTTFFREHSPQWLNESRRLERLVDRMLKERKQPSLFDKDSE